MQNIILITGSIISFIIGLYFILMVNKVGLIVIRTWTYSAVITSLLSGWYGGLRVTLLIMTIIIIIAIIIDEIAENQISINENKK